MPTFKFEFVEARQPTLGTQWADLQDRETARQYAIGLAETMLQRGTASVDAQGSIVVMDDDGEVLDTIYPHQT